MVKANVRIEACCEGRDGRVLDEQRVDEREQRVNGVARRTAVSSLKVEARDRPLVEQRAEALVADPSGCTLDPQ